METFRGSILMLGRRGVTGSTPVRLPENFKLSSSHRPPICGETGRERAQGAHPNHFARIPKGSVLSGCTGKKPTLFQ
jgi:hypothetical protein